MSKKSNIVTEELPAELEIAQVQLERLRHASRAGLLTYEEVKIFDLLSKNLLEHKKLNTKEKTVNPIKATLLQNAELKELLRLASQFKTQDIEGTLDIVDEKE